MPLPPQLGRLIEEAKKTALENVGGAFNRATQRVMEREAASGAHLTGGQIRAAVECLCDAEARLAQFTTEIKRLLAAAGHAPNSDDQRALIDLYSGVTEHLMTEVGRRGDLAPQSNFTERGIMLQQLGAEIQKVRRRCRNEFETILMECGNSRQNPTISIVYNVSGPNARVNTGSVDMSTNTVKMGETQFFADLRQKIATIPDEAERRRLLEEFELLQTQKGKGGLAATYLKFVEHTANHMTLLGPFLPALSQWIQRVAG